ncbi:carbohydrate ABC transporter permease [Gracilinema caldarium]|uniref:carbohydrate ABC transporter permease n=1 Tax=Gracilinema caldarium TaxID=215591 RepID=UPI0026EBE67B|nr:carbohydrate ABC transporter permease [Gracilinema caldarium]
MNNGIIRDLDLKQASVRFIYDVILFFAVMTLFLCLAPVVWVLFSGFKDIKEFTIGKNILPERFDLQRYIETWKRLRFVRYYQNSFISVVGSVFCAVIFNGLLGYVLSKIKPRGAKLIYGLVMWSMLIPATTSIVPLFININRIGLSGSFIPLWLSMGANAFYVIMFKNFFDVLPMSLVEAAKIDGSTDLQIFRDIAIPLSQPIIMVIIMFSINAAWSDFLLPYLVLNNTGLETVMVRLFQFRTATKATDVEILRAVTFVMVPPILLFLIFQKQITQVNLQSGIKG